MSTCAINITTGELTCPICAPQPPCPKGYVCPQVCTPLIVHEVHTLTSAGLILAIVALAAITAAALNPNRRK